MAHKKPTLIKRRGKKSATPSFGGRGGYAAFLSDLKIRIRAAQTRAALSVNKELIQLYWDIGRIIVQKQRTQTWGAAVIERLAADIGGAFPGISGFSASNIWRMRAFFIAFSGDTAILAQPVRELAPPPILARPVRELAKARNRSRFVSQAARQLSIDAPPEPMASLPWGHNVTLIESIADPSTRLWYARKALENGWSRNMLDHWIESNLHARQGKAITNFKTALPLAQSDLAEQILKEPYNFDFLTLGEDALEKELEEGLLEHITRFLVELGEGFAFVGKQVRLEGQQEKRRG